MKLFGAALLVLLLSLAAAFSMIFGFCFTEIYPGWINNEYEMVFVIISCCIILPFMFFAIASNLARYIVNHKKVGGIL